MANKNVFKPKTRVAPAADTTNDAGGKAYSRNDKDILAQFAATNCFNDTFYTSSSSNLEHILEVCSRIDDLEFLSKAAIYSRKSMKMKDMPAFLTAYLCAQGDRATFEKTFTVVIDDVKMLRNFVQIIRSGAVGRTSFGSHPKRLIRNFLNNMSAEAIFKSSIGKDPSLGDIIKMVHPKPDSDEKSVLYKYLIGKELTVDEHRQMPEVYRQLLQFRSRFSDDVPRVPYEMLTSSELSTDQWKAIAANMSWNQLRMNINTLARHDVFKDKALTQEIAKKIKHPTLVKRNLAFPYQLLSAYLNTRGNDSVPRAITSALQDALELSLFNVPSFGDNVTVLVDVSGSMGSPITGNRGSATSKVSCSAVAAMLASCVLKTNPEANVVAFDTRASLKRLNPRDSIVTNAEKIFSAWGGGTDTSCGLRFMIENDIKSDVVIMISDNMSWFDGDSRFYSSTLAMHEWKRYKVMNRNAKLVCIDLQPGSSTQVKSDKDILNVGGFSDNVFKVIDKWLKSNGNADFWTDLIESCEVYD